MTNFNSCDALLADFRAAALARTKPSPEAAGAGSAPGWTGGGSAEDGNRSGADAEAPAAAAPVAPQNADEAAKGAAQPAAGPGYSGTNVHEQGVDEPDLVKTDGRRVFTVADGELRVLDVATRAQTGKLTLPGASASEMLLSGNRALLVMTGGDHTVYEGPTQPRAPESSADMPAPAAGRAKLVLVDLSGPTPTSLGELSVDGGYVDARQIGSTARVVIRSYPSGPVVKDTGGGSYSSRYTKAIEKTTVDDWLPSYTLTANGSTNSGRLVDCSAVSRPETEPGTPGHTGVSTLSVLSFDLNRELDTGSPVTIAADADTVYASASNLYVAANYQPLRADSGRQPSVYQPRTAIYQFDISGTGTPRHVASGDVDGTLLNQYSLSEHANHLRVATTSQKAVDTKSGRGDGASAREEVTSVVPDMAAPVGNTESAVTVLALGGAELREVGRAGGLGRGERIYAVRFTGNVGYVVTFRQTDPLYTLDLTDPRAPKVVGELKINGYSAYLHPVDGGKLIGVGQDATDTGRRLGTQVSLFDVGNLADPRRIANYTVALGGSEAEMDPHAFLYWPQTGTLVIPLQTPHTVVQPAVPPGSTGGSGGSGGSGTAGSTGASPGSGSSGGTGSSTASGSSPGTSAPVYAPTSQALVLRLEGGAFAEVGKIAHPGGGQMRRSLVIGDALWTVSTRGVMVSDLATLAQRAWVPFV
ncbi:beta-propeller domain-containing protein [Yinghuangia sp. YIM S10712]|uniref:beta-propeller domain-containing protein n=1 Tax=Yinghuangia sp. YIM S10712 TaxID=3436930 RepID=UPI003F52ECE4